MDGVVGEQVDGWLGEQTSEQSGCWWAGEWMDGQVKGRTKGPIIGQLV